MPEMWPVDGIHKTLEVGYRGQQSFEAVGVFKPGDTLASRVLPGLMLPQHLEFGHFPRLCRLHRGEFPTHRWTLDISRGSAARRAERLCLSGDHSFSFWRLRRRWSVSDSPEATGGRHI